MRPNGPPPGSGGAKAGPLLAGGRASPAPPHSRRSGADQARRRAGDQRRRAGDAGSAPPPPAGSPERASLQPPSRSPVRAAPRRAVASSTPAARASPVRGRGRGPSARLRRPAEGLLAVPGAVAFAGLGGRCTSHATRPGVLASWRPHSTRLETRTKECSRCASLGVAETLPRAQ